MSYMQSVKMYWWFAKQCAKQISKKIFVLSDPGFPGIEGYSYLYPYLGCLKADDQQLVKHIQVKSYEEEK